MNKNVVIVEDKDQEGNEIKVIVKRPSNTQTVQGHMVESKKFNEGIKQGNLTRISLDSHLRANGEWDDTKEAELKDLAKKIYAGERQLARGGRSKDGATFTKKDGRKLALDMATWRFDQLNLLAATRRYDSKTVEGTAENAKFDYYMSVCILNEDETPHFKSVEDYSEMADKDHPYINMAAGELANLVYNYDPEFEKKRPEFKFLVKYNYSTDDGILLNDAGDMVNDEGDLVNKEGRAINKDGDFIDYNGEVVDDEGNPVEDFVEFADETPVKKAVKSAKK